MEGAMEAEATEAQRAVETEAEGREVEKVAEEMETEV